LSDSVAVALCVAVSSLQPLIALRSPSLTPSFPAVAPAARPALLKQATLSLQALAKLADVVRTRPLDTPAIVGPALYLCLTTLSLDLDTTDVADAAIVAIATIAQSLCTTPDGVAVVSGAALTLVSKARDGALPCKCLLLHAKGLCAILSAFIATDTVPDAATESECLNLLRMFLLCGDTPVALAVVQQVRAFAQPVLGQARQDPPGVGALLAYRVTCAMATDAAVILLQTSQKTSIEVATECFRLVILFLGAVLPEHRDAVIAHVLSVQVAMLHPSNPPLLLQLAVNSALALAKTDGPALKAALQALQPADRSRFEQALRSHGQAAQPAPAAPSDSDVAAAIAAKRAQRAAAASTAQKVELKMNFANFS